ncbi:RRP15-like protein [Sarcoptes scabiei]|uniref:RRP15-like protein n=1 Tax=Sarcoptes scabiei TaxID=52283 RepID=A0A131ZTP2_SARSC|nr:RRP15-like protein [Sarcoptes scabiei]
MSTNPGFAFVVNSILNSNKNVKILSKAKKESDLLMKDEEGDKKKDDPIVFIDKHGNETEIESLSLASKLKKKRLHREKKFNQKSFNRKLIDDMARLKPDKYELEKEKLLRTIATKGVVQLFNVVKEKQRILKTKLNEAGSSDSKRIKALREFREIELKSNNIIPRKKSKKSPKETKKWTVLQDDFMLQTKMKDWDKDDDDDQNRFDGD